MEEQEQDLPEAKDIGLAITAMSVVAKVCKFHYKIEYNHNRNKYKVSFLSEKFYGEREKDAPMTDGIYDAIQQAVGWCKSHFKELDSWIEESQKMKDEIQLQNKR